MSAPVTPIMKMTKEEIIELSKNEARKAALSDLNRMKLNKRLANLNRNTSGLAKSSQTALSSSVVTPSLQTAFKKTILAVPKLGINTRKEEGGKRRRRRKTHRRR